MAENEITIYERVGNSLESISQLGDWLFKSGLFGCERPEQGKVLALACMAERRNPMEIARTYHIIEGRLSMRADAMQAEFQKAGGIIKWIRSDDEECTAEFSHPVYCPKPITINRTLQRFRDNGTALSSKSTKDNPILKTNWTKSPDAMLRARVISAGVRMVMPGIVAGYYTPEEIQDFDPSRVTVADPLPLLPAIQAPIAPATTTTNAEPAEDYEAKLKEIIGEDAGKAARYLCSLGWIGPDDSILQMSPEHMAQIIARPGPFMAKVRAQELPNE